MEGLTIGVFGTEPETKTAIETSLAKKSEAEGIIVYHRTDSGRRVSFLDDAQFPERIQGYARIASIVDHAFYIFPKSGRLGAPDGELAVLLESLSVRGTVEIVDQSGTPEMVLASLKGTRVAEYPIEQRSTASSVLDLSGLMPREEYPPKGKLVYIDRAFTVKGVGTVALGFMLFGSVSVHDQLRPVPGAEGVRADVKGIQINDEDFESAGRGIRVGLSLRGIEPEDLDRSKWFDDGSLALSDRLTIGFGTSPFYKKEVVGRDLHLQLPGEMLAASIAEGPSEGEILATLPTRVPVWNGMKVAVIDLNGKNLRVAGGGTCKV